MATTSTDKHPISFWNRLVPALGTLLVLLAIGNIARSVVDLNEPRELMYGESIIYDQAARILRGEPLYQPVG